MFLPSLRKTCAKFTVPFVTVPSVLVRVTDLPGWPWVAARRSRRPRAQGRSVARFLRKAEPKASPKASGRPCRRPQEEGLAEVLAGSGWIPAGSGWFRLVLVGSGWFGLLLLCFCSGSFRFRFGSDPYRFFSFPVLFDSGRSWLFPFPVLSGSVLIFGSVFVRFFSVRFFPVPVLSVRRLVFRFVSVRFLRFVSVPMLSCYGAH